MQVVHHVNHRHTCQRDALAQRGFGSRGKQTVFGQAWAL